MFAVHECGLVARCAMERDDGGEVRLSKIFDIIGFCSDIAGQDIQANYNEVSHALAVVRNWLQANLPRKTGQLPGPSQLQLRYIDFRRQLPIMCRVQQLKPSELTFLDYRTLVEGWLDENPRPA